MIRAVKGWIIALSGVLMFAAELMVIGPPAAVEVRGQGWKVPVSDMPKTAAWWRIYDVNAG